MMIESPIESGVLVRLKMPRVIRSDINEQINASATNFHERSRIIKNIHTKIKLSDPKILISFWKD